MKHASPAALDALEPLLAQLRALPGLKEKSRGVFYLRARAFLHFHEDPTGLFADIRPPGAADFRRLPATGESAQSAILTQARTAIEER